MAASIGKAIVFSDLLAELEDVADRLDLLLEDNGFTVTPEIQADIDRGVEEAREFLEKKLNAYDPSGKLEEGGG